MSEDEGWGPWIEHDGGRVLNPPLKVAVQLEVQGGGIWPPTTQISTDWPGFFWRWKSVRDGLFGSRRIRVCDDPAYAPIVRYRFREPRALRELREIVANPAPLPEGVDA